MVTPLKHKQSWSKEEDGQLRILCGQKLKVRKIARIMQRSIGSTRMRIRKFGIRFNIRTHEICDRLKELSDSGCSIKAAAKKLKIKYTQGVYHWKKLGLSAHRGTEKE